MSGVDATPGSTNVIRFTGRHVHAAGFSCRDLMDLASWDGRGCRLEVDPAIGSGDLGQFAMIYTGREPWASWAISREDGRVLLWDCITLCDLGRFDSVRAALAAVPVAAVPVAGQTTQAAAAEVIPLVTMLARRPAA